MATPKGRTVGVTDTYEGIIAVPRLPGAVGAGLVKAGTRIGVVGRVEVTE